MAAAMFRPDVLLLFKKPKKRVPSTSLKDKNDENMQPAATQTSPIVTDLKDLRCKFCTASKKPFKNRSSLLSHLRNSHSFSIFKRKSSPPAVEIPTKKVTPSPSTVAAPSIERPPWRLIGKSPRVEKKPKLPWSGPLSCPFCHRTKTRRSCFKTEQTFRDHIRRFHGFLCPHCDAISKDSLKAHEHWRWCGLRWLLEKTGVRKLSELDASPLYWSLALERGKVGKMASGAPKRWKSEEDLNWVDLDEQFLQDVSFQAAFNTQPTQEMEVDNSDLERFFVIPGMQFASSNQQSFDLFAACNTDSALNEAVSFFTRFLFE